MASQQAPGRNEPRALAWFLVEQEGAVLVVRLQDDASAFPGLWTLPGDLVREGESAVQAILRFARDELGVKVLGQDRMEAMPLRDSGALYEVEVYRVGFEGRLRYGSSGPFHEVDWATKSNLPEPMPAALRTLLQRLLKVESSSGDANDPSHR